MFNLFKKKKIKVILENGTFVMMDKKQLASFWLSLELPYKRALNRDDIYRFYQIQILYIENS
jgi:hypothetical protein